MYHESLLSETLPRRMKEITHKIEFTKAGGDTDAKLEVLQNSVLELIKIIVELYYEK